MWRSPLPDEGGGTGSGNGSSDRRRELMRWAGLGTQVVASVGVSVFLGVKADKWLKLSFPILSWVLPLLVIAGLLINLVREGSKKNNGK
jgi:Mn2+/Fe2+ NRAMP family transporter